jgi:esterase/lipase superfamily enzyme
MAAPPFALRGGFVTGLSLRRPISAVSRRALMRGFAALAGAGTLAGCAGLAATGPQFDASRVATKPKLLVATTRKPIGGARAKPWFGAERSATTIAAQATLTPPDTSRFSLGAVGLSDWRLDGVELMPGQVADLAAQASQGRDILVYVHGYKNTFESAALDAARLADGISFRGDTMVFSWPSRSGLLDYAYDRESAMYSRDALERVLDVLTTSPGGARIHIVAHSLGTMLTLESLRQLHASHGDLAAAKIGAVIFAAPDIDMDVFTSSIPRIGMLASKITVVAASNDLALAVSRKIAGGVTRVGAAEKAQLERLGLRVIDASNEGWGVINHDLFMSNDAVRQVIRRAVDVASTNA